MLQLLFQIEQIELLDVARFYCHLPVCLPVYFDCVAEHFWQERMRVAAANEMSFGKYFLQTKWCEVWLVCWLRCTESCQIGCQYVVVQPRQFVVSHAVLGGLPFHHALCQIAGEGSMTNISKAFLAVLVFLVAYFLAVFLVMV